MRQPCRKETTMADDRITAALRALLDWGREHTGPRDPNSPHVLLIEAAEALKAAGQAKPDTIELMATVRITVARDAADDWIEERTIYDMLAAPGAEIEGPMADEDAPGALYEPIKSDIVLATAGGGVVDVPLDLRGVPGIGKSEQVGAASDLARALAGRMREIDPNDAIATDSAPLYSLLWDAILDECRAAAPDVDMPGEIGRAAVAVLLTPCPFCAEPLDPTGPDLESTWQQYRCYGCGNWIDKPAA
jgi:hypothetical protein